MKLNPSSLSLKQDSSLDELFARKVPQAVQLLREAKVRIVNDLFWVFPKKIYPAPNLQSFHGIKEGQLFRGMGKVVRFQSHPNPYRYGRRKIPLGNLLLVVEDVYSGKHLSLRWFNCYKSVSEKLKRCSTIKFQGKVQIYKNNFQIVNPSYEEASTPPPPLHLWTQKKTVITEYPTINSVPGKKIKDIINRIPSILWENIVETLPPFLVEKRHFLPLCECFKILHGKNDHWSEEKLKKARERIIYQEFLDEQLMIFLRKSENHRLSCTRIRVSRDKVENLKAILPYTLTVDQERALQDIEDDMKGDHPMMRLIQGDVGCGKTVVAFMGAWLVCESGHQSAFMCPTETLAYQHFLNMLELAKNLPYRVSLLLGSTPAKEKKDILTKLRSGVISLVIGTHSLIQESVSFKSLALAVIDEQHKFGVNQRLALTHKGRGCHCLIMTATPIPRSLRLTQYGDLSVTTIKTMPVGRKGFQTRIVTEATFLKFLSFVKTRLSMGEQGLVVAPTIEESERLDRENVQKTLNQYSKLFPQHTVEAIHGKLAGLEKRDILQRFAHHHIDLLIATSVVEVGIDVANTTIMAVLSPECFGLSSLHQLRGRVGRGDKPGFCFLVTGIHTSKQALERLRIVESCSDGFTMAEEDLKIRGEGDLFGTDQSGEGEGKRKMANILLHGEQLHWAREDGEYITKKGDQRVLSERFSRQEFVAQTI